MKIILRGLFEYLESGEELDQMRLRGDEPMESLAVFDGREVMVTVEDIDSADDRIERQRAGARKGGYNTAKARVATPDVEKEKK